MKALTARHLTAVNGEPAPQPAANRHLSQRPTSGSAGGFGDFQPASLQIIFCGEDRAKLTVKFPERGGIGGPLDDLLLQFGFPAGQPLQLALQPDQFLASRPQLGRLG
jgi:hypothetical protein